MRIDSSTCRRPYSFISSAWSISFLYIVIASSSPARSCFSIVAESFDVFLLATSVVGVPPKNATCSASRMACWSSSCAWTNSSFWIESYCAPVITAACWTYWIAAWYSLSIAMLRPVINCVLSLMFFLFILFLYFYFLVIANFWLDSCVEVVVFFVELCA